MNIEIKGFTLIELLVTMVIIGVLSTVSVSTFNNYFGKANDAVKEQATSEMGKIVMSAQIARGEIDYSDLNNDGTLDDKDDIITFFESQGYSIPKFGGDRCLVYGYLDSNYSTFLDSNGQQITERGSEFFIISQSSKNTQNGVISGYIYYLNGSQTAKVGLKGKRYENTPSGVLLVGTGRDVYPLMNCDNPNLFTTSGINFNFKKFNISD